MPLDPLRGLVETWNSKLDLAKEFADKCFFVYAKECMAFYDGPHNDLYRSSGEKMSSIVGKDVTHPKPTFRVTVNKAAELVQLFGPRLYFKNPIRVVKPRDIPNFDTSVFGPEHQEIYGAIITEMSQRRALQELRCQLLSQYLNYTPRELDLKSHARKAIDEALLKPSRQFN